MFFKDIPGKSEEKQKLIKQIKEDRIPHAQLFLGNEGSANLAMALAFVSYLFCENKQESDSCGECANCNKSHKWIHPDLHFSFPVVKKDDKKREETTSDDFLPQWRLALQSNPYMTISQWQGFIQATTKPNINTKECNDIIQKLAYQAFGTGPKVLIMWMPEYLGKEGNKLLKLIEEPTDNTYLILVANDQNKILNTILSRCQLMKFLPYFHEELQEYIEKQYGIDATIAQQYVKLSEGNLSTAIALAKEGEKDLSSNLFNWLRISYKEDAEEIQSFIAEFTAQSMDGQIQFLEYGLHYFQNFYCWLMTDHQNHNMTEHEIEVAQKMKSIISPESIEKINREINFAITGLLRNSNPKINMSALTIKIGDILKNKPQSSTINSTFAEEMLIV